MDIVSATQKTHFCDTKDTVHFVAFLPLECARFVSLCPRFMSLCLSVSKFYVSVCLCISMCLFVSLCSSGHKRHILASKRAQTRWRRAQLSILSDIKSKISICAQNTNDRNESLYNEWPPCSSILSYSTKSAYLRHHLSYYVTRKYQYLPNPVSFTFSLWRLCLVLLFTSTSRVTGTSTKDAARRKQTVITVVYYKVIDF